MKTFTVEVTQVVTVTQADREAVIPYLQDSEWHPSEVRCGEADSHWLVQAFASHRIACAPDDLTASPQLEHSGLISREKYNHIVENIRAREKVREAMA